MTDTDVITGQDLIRLGGMSDVTIAARLLTADAPAMDIDGDGVVDAPDDPGQAASALRMFLTHAVLEHGRIWVSEQEGSLTAASVWLPPDTGSFRDEMALVLSRELSLDVDGAVPAPNAAVTVLVERAMRDVVDIVARARPAQVLLNTGVVVDGRDDAGRDRLRSAVVAPELDAQRHSGGTAVAVEVHAHKVPGLVMAGFERLGEAALGRSHAVWVGVALP
jgi:hypothetical protein